MTSLSISSKAARVLLTIMLGFTLSLVYVSTCEAKTLFTYSGKAIQSKESKSTATISSGKTCKVKHTQTRVYNKKGTHLTVAIQKQQLFGWSTVGSTSYVNDVTNKVYSTYCTAGTYRLYFQSSEAKYKFNISGKFYY